MNVRAGSERERFAISQKNVRAGSGQELRNFNQSVKPALIDS